MRGKLKDGMLYIAGGKPFEDTNLSLGPIVDIVDSEDHHIFGKRYMIKGYNEWFEENCFEYITRNKNTPYSEEDDIKIGR